MKAARASWSEDEIEWREVRVPTCKYGYTLYVTDEDLKLNLGQGSFAHPLGEPMFCGFTSKFLLAARRALQSVGATL